VTHVAQSRAPPSLRSAQALPGPWTTGGPPAAFHSSSNLMSERSYGASRRRRPDTNAFRFPIAGGRVPAPGGLVPHAGRPVRRIEHQARAYVRRAFGPGGVCSSIPAKAVGDLGICFWTGAVGMPFPLPLLGLFSKPSQYAVRAFQGNDNPAPASIPPGLPASLDREDVLYTVGRRAETRAHGKSGQNSHAGT